MGISARSEERRVGKSVDLGGRRIIKKKKGTEDFWAGWGLSVVLSRPHDRPPANRTRPAGARPRRPSQGGPPADHVAVRQRDADRLVGVAADRAAAAGEEQPVDGDFG